MIQLYFLSVLCNGLSGYILFSGGEEESIEKSMRLSVNNPTFHLVLGILSAVIGFLKLLSPFENRLPILGDLVPALAGIIAGFILVFGMYRRGTVSPEPEKSLDHIGENLLRIRKPLGIGLLAIALAHFLFPQALFL
jgi:hypothetical protein